MKGENVIFASIWLLLLNSLECAKNTYSASIKIICPHKESQPLENGVNKRLCSLPFELSVLSPLGIVTEDVCACTDVCVCVCVRKQCIQTFLCFNRMWVHMREPITVLQLRHCDSFSCMTLERGKCLLQTFYPDQYFLRCSSICLG